MVEKGCNKIPILRLQDTLPKIALFKDIWSISAKADISAKCKYCPVSFYGKLDCCHRHLVRKAKISGKVLGHLFAGLCLEGAGILLMFTGVKCHAWAKIAMIFLHKQFLCTLWLKWHGGCGGRDVMQLNAERATVGRKGQIPHLWENPDFVESRST